MVFDYAARSLAGPCVGFTSIASGILFGSVGFVLFVLRTSAGASENEPTDRNRFLVRMGLRRRSAEWSILPPSEEPATKSEAAPPVAVADHAKPLVATLQSVMTLCEALSQFGGILLAIYVCEFYPVFPHSTKTTDMDLFWAWTLLLMILGFRGVKEQKDTTLLNRAQTEEWKGWMQWMFLLYHYYHAESVYNSIRVMITCYVWMTGFGNFSFFYMKRDFGAVRILQMLFRLNFLVLCLMMTLGNTYMLYYICPLHTFFFLMVWVIMRIKPEWNHTKDMIRYKLAAAACVVYLVWDLGTFCFWPYLFGWLSSSPILGATGGTQWEWYFRSTLDHWSTFLGMIFALNYPVATQWLKTVEELPARRQWLVKGLSVLGVSLPLVWWCATILPEKKLVYNQTNAYYSPLFALLGYVFLRNISKTLRAQFLEPLEIIGKTTLETYLLQHHLWLTSNAKSLLTLVPGMPVVNFVLVTCCYFAAARRLYKLTMSIRGMLLPDNLQQCLRNTGGVAALVAASLVVAGLLRFMFTAVPMLVMLAVVCGCGAAAVLVGLPRALGDDPHFPAQNILTEQCACACALALGLYVLTSLVGFGGYPSAPETCGPQKVLPAKESCSMAHPGLGLFMLALCGIMLYTRDNYLGIPTLVLYLCENVVITHEQAYGPLHEQLGVEEKSGEASSREGQSGSGLGGGTLRQAGDADVAVDTTAAEESEVLANNDLKTLSIA